MLELILRVRIVGVQHHRIVQSATTTTQQIEKTKATWKGTATRTFSCIWWSCFSLFTLQTIFALAQTRIPDGVAGTTTTTKVSMPCMHYCAVAKGFSNIPRQPTILARQGHSTAVPLATKYQRLGGEYHPTPVQPSTRRTKTGAIFEGGARTVLTG